MTARPAEKLPRQERSRESLRRMLDAAEVVIAKRGLEGLTLGRIARQARMSRTNVYRRFRDKEALIAAFFRRLNERSSQATREQFDAEQARSLGLVRFTIVMEAMVKGFRSSARLSRAAVEYSHRHWEADFIRRSRESESRSFQQMADTFLLWRGQIRHADPERALRFAFLAVGCMLRDLILFDRMPFMQAVLPVDDDVLKQELPRMFLRYLGVAVEEIEGSLRTKKKVRKRSSAG